jgi:hypothetical protein
LSEGADRRNQRHRETGEKQARHEPIDRIASPIVAAHQVCDHREHHGSCGDECQDKCDSAGHGTPRFRDGSTGSCENRCRVGSSRFQMDEARAGWNGACSPTQPRKAASGRAAAKPRRIAFRGFPRIPDEPYYSTIRRDEARALLPFLPLAAFKACWGSYS